MEIVLNIFGYFGDIFSEKADQARLITVLISAFVALLVVLINQKLTSTRERKQFLDLKIEELFEEVSSFQKLFNEFLYIAGFLRLKPELSVDEKDNIDRRTGLLIDDKSEAVRLEAQLKLTKIDMLINLYFKDILNSKMKVITVAPHEVEKNTYEALWMLNSIMFPQQILLFEKERKCENYEDIKLDIRHMATMFCETIQYFCQKKAI